MILIISYLVAAAAAFAIFLAFVVRGRPTKANHQTLLASLSRETEASAFSTSVPSVSRRPPSCDVSYTCPIPSAPPLVSCEICSSFSIFRCSRCKITRYCSLKCQTIHWKQGHKKECRPHQRNDAGSCSNQKMPHNQEPSVEAVSSEGGDSNISETVRISDPDVFVCPICFENLSIPVYQCKNGHILCSVCSATVTDFCPTCNSQSKHYRCRGIEKILESVKVVCPNKKYGCTMIVPWIDRCAHEATCLFPPCCCPITNCGFVGTNSQLSAHVSTKHDNVIRFSHGQTFRATLSRNIGFRVLLEEKKGTVFVLQNQRQVDGNAFSISAIGFERFFYELQVRHGERTQSIKVPTDIFQRFQVDHVPTHYLIVPVSYFNSLDEIKLKIKVHAQGNRR